MEWRSCGVLALLAVTAIACGAKEDGPTGAAPEASCGACPAGYSCGTANGLAVCRAPSGIPLFQNVFVIVMENVSRNSIETSPDVPYLHGLGRSAASGADYHGVTHPSLPNYLAMVAGDTGGVTCNCSPNPGGPCNPAECETPDGYCGCGLPDPTIGDQLDAARLSWKSYAEDMGEPCNWTPSGLYAVRHVPFLYYDALTADRARCDARVVDFTHFAADLASAPPAFSFITPNLVNDMHDPIDLSGMNYAVGDRWLSIHAQPILDSPSFRKGGLLVIVWDENDLSGLVVRDEPIPIYLMSPFAKAGGYLSTVWADHYSLLATLEDGLGLARLGKAATAEPLRDYFPDE